MSNHQKRLELLAPAGNFEKLQIAVHYGADAVYLAGNNYSLRNQSQNFSFHELGQAVEFAHQNNVKVYIACNIYPRTHEAAGISAYLDRLSEIHPDGVIIADPGVIKEAKRRISHIPIHLSTQANTTSLACAKFWQEFGIKRINTARELSLPEIARISVGTTIEIEAFVHGAMCIAYSGRCLLSSFLANRDGNRGMCAHPCRWKYSVMEELRPGEYLPIIEDDKGSYLFNSKDLCMIDHIPDLAAAGITSLKIEGRMKGIYYLAATVKTYRDAIDAYLQSPNSYHVPDIWRKTLAGVTQRGYCTGFYFSDPDQVIPEYDIEKFSDAPQFAAKIRRQIRPDTIEVEVRNKVSRGDMLTILPAEGPAVSLRILHIRMLMSPDFLMVESAQSGTVAELILDVEIKCSTNDIITKLHSIVVS